MVWYYPWFYFRVETVIYNYRTLNSYHHPRTGPLPPRLRDRNDAHHGEGPEFPHPEDVAELSPTQEIFTDKNDTDMENARMFVTVVGDARKQPVADCITNLEAHVPD